MLDKLSEYKVDGLANLLLMDDKESGKGNRGFAFLEMMSQSAALKALRLLSKPDIRFGAHLPAKVRPAEVILLQWTTFRRINSLCSHGLPETERHQGK